MRRDFLCASALVACYGTLPTAAFIPSSSSSMSNGVNSRHKQIQRTWSGLNLVPEQGNQLVAAYTAALSKYQENHEDEDILEEFDNTDVGSTNRNFLQRVFSLPSASKKVKVMAPTTTTIITSRPSSSSSCDDPNQEILLFPLVGFTFCRHGNQVVPLPTQSNLACRLPPSKEGDVYGWYSPVCKLNMYAVNEEEYCTAPSS